MSYHVTTSIVALADLFFLTNIYNTYGFDLSGLVEIVPDVVPSFVLMHVVVTDTVSNKPLKRVKIYARKCREGLTKFPLSINRLNSLLPFKSSRVSCFALSCWINLHCADLYCIGD